MHRRDFLHQASALGASLAMTEPVPADHERRDFERHQAKRRQELWGLLGDLPQRKKPAAKLVKTEKHDGFTLEHLVLDLNGVEPVAAYLLLPDKRPDPAPGLLYIHAHGGTYAMGKEELLQGRKVLPAYAPVCAAKGLVTLAIDSWCFSSRNHSPPESTMTDRKEGIGQRSEWDTFKWMLWQGQVLWGMMMFDEVQAVSYLSGRPEVDPKRLGAFGLSMGSTKAWWLAALDPRIRLCIDLCCLTDFQELVKTNNLQGHGIYYYVPKLLKHFRTQDINELIVPRPHLSLNGRRDALTPPAGVERVRDHLLPLYGKFGRRQDCRIELFDCGHEETPEMRQLVSNWLDRYLVEARE